MLLSNIKKIFFNNNDFLNNETLMNGNMSESSLLHFRRKRSLKQINNIYYFWNYDKDFKILISTMKFKNKMGLAREISELIKEGVSFVLEKEEIDYIIPVPISKERQTERGFNQVEVILEELKLQYTKIKRIKNTKKMFQILNEEKRDQNIKNSFFVTSDTDLNNKNILLFDDIITTGSTLREIKKEIQKTYNIKKVIVLTLAAAREIKVNKGKI